MRVDAAAVPGGLRAYPAVAAPGAPDWRGLITAATDQIDILEPAIASVILLPGTIDLLRQRAARGCRIRIISGIPIPQLYPLLDKRRIDLHWTEPTILSSYRFDDDFLVPLRIGPSDDHFPVFHFHRASEPWLGARLEQRFQHIWENHSGPVVSLADSQNRRPPGPTRHEIDSTDGQGLAAGSQAAADSSNEDHRASSTPAGSVLTDGPRRWPGRRP